MEGAYDVGDCVGAEGIYLTDSEDADAGDDNVRWSAVEGEWAFYIFDLQDVARRDCEMRGHGGLGNAAREEHLGEFGGRACYCDRVSCGVGVGQEGRRTC